MRHRDFHGYTVWEDGKIQSPKGRILSPSITPKGYQSIGVKIDGQFRTWLHHKVVAYAWLGSRPPGMEIHHKNGDRKDNRVVNLAYVSKTENNQDSYDSGRRDVSGINNANCKLTECEVREICHLLELGSMSLSAMARHLKVGRGTINHIKHGRQWVHISKSYYF